LFCNRIEREWLCYKFLSSVDRFASTLFVCVLQKH